MQTLEVKNVSYISWIVIIFAILLLYLSYFFLYIPKQEGVVQERGFRILKEYGNNMYGKYNYYEEHFKNYGVFYPLRSEMKTSPKLDHVIQQVYPTVYKFINEDLIKEIKVVPKKSGSSNPLITEDHANMIFELDPKTSSNDTNASTPDFIGNININQYSFLVPINTFMQKLKFDRFFENIILLDRNVVYYNSKHNQVHDITNPKVLCDSAQYHQGGKMERIEIRGVKYRVLILPLSFKEENFFFAGIISDEVFREKTRTINSQLLTILGSILLLILTSMPILKITLINRHERLRMSDAYSTLFSVIISTGLLVLLLISLIEHQFSDELRQDKRLESIAKELRQNVETDLNSIVDLYAAIDSSKKKDNKQTKATRQLAHFVDSCFESANYSSSIGDHLKWKPIPVNEFLLVDSVGTLTKIVAQTASPSIVKTVLNKRRYFNFILSPDSAWYHPKLKKHFYIESIKSYNTGSLETAISFPCTNYQSETQNQSAVMAITSPIPSLYQQVLPRDIKFVVIDHRGRVLFHSIDSKNLHENFLDECTPSFKSGNIPIDENIHLTYNEKEWKARIQPIAHTSLYHITLLDHNQIDQRNMVVFFYSTLLFLFTLIMLAVGILVLRRTFSRPQEFKMASWSLNWILFRQRNYPKYRILSYTFSCLLVLQIIPFLWIKGPMLMFLFQLIIITLSGLIAIVVLDRNKSENTTNISKIRLSEWLLIATIVILASLFALLSDHRVKDLPLLVITAGIIILLFVHENRTVTITSNSPKWLQKIATTNRKHITDHSKVVSTYNKFMLLWLLIIAVIPLIQYFVTIKQQEENLYRLEKMHFLANENLKLTQNKNITKIKNLDWFKAIQGNRIDHAQIAICNEELSKQKTGKRTVKSNTLSSMYLKFPFEFNSVHYFKEMMEEKTPTDTLLYIPNGFKQAIQVSLAPTKNNRILYWLLFLASSVLLVRLFIFRLFQYMAGNILNTDPRIGVVPVKHALKSLLEKIENNRILLDTFDSAYCLQYIQNYKEKHPDFKLIIITPDELIGNRPLPTANSANNQTIIWINDLDQLMPLISKHDLILSQLQRVITQSTHAKLIIPIAFELDFIHELYDDYIAENKPDTTEKAQLYEQRKRWGTLFKDFNKYTGEFVFDKSDETEVKSVKVQGASQVSFSKYAHWERQVLTPENSFKKTLELEYFIEPRYKYIWSNLCRIEKLILLDLADDGLINLKNRHVIKRLALKGLIKPSPYPTLFSETFRYYLNDSVSAAEKKELERKLSQKGSWRNMRYLLLFIIFLLASFVFISQGVSIEKIIGILAGILALFSGMMRVFDYNTFKPSSG